jgi:hypothetical protein
MSICAIGADDYRHQHLKFCSTAVIWPYKNSSDGQASDRNSIFPTAQMPGR